MSTVSSPSSFAKVASLLHVLSDDSALRILDKAKVGFKSGKLTIKELKLTPRMYYRKLRELNECGILMPIGDEYKLTQLGALLHRLLLKDVSGFLLGNQNLFLPMEKIGNTSEVTVINDYNKLIVFLVDTIDKTKSEILLATRYIDFSVMQRLSYVLERNVNVKSVTSSKIDLAGAMKLLGDALFSIRPNFLKFLGSKANYRYGDVPLSLIIIDGEITVFEIPDKQFKAAFVTMDKEIVRILSGLFWELWKQSQTLSFFQSR